ncbi:hypothetical protein K1719_043516 [Acacia pycnantha]|nr:hypothetical protein K1719_043516 [Acacia pycnantha]
MQHPLLNMQKFEQNQRPNQTEAEKQYSHHRILVASLITIEVGLESMKLPQISPVVNLTHSSHVFKKSMYSHWKFLVLHQFDSFQQEIYVQPLKILGAGCLVRNVLLSQHYSACVALDDSKIKYNWTGKTLGRIEEHIIWDNLIFPISLLC